jgi:hypothetical protein
MTRYRANGPRFVDETVDGEALIMDMVQGAYFTCQGPAAVAWDALKRGSDPSEITAMLSSRYEVSSTDVESDVAGFVAELLREEMLVVRDDSSPPDLRPSLDGTAAPAGPYEAMSLERYTDLADLILLDPVHDVSDAGWPQAPH